MALQEEKIENVLTFIEPGPVVLVATRNGETDNLMTISWTIALDFNQDFALCTGPWNESFQTLMDTKECVVAVPGADLMEQTVRVGTVDGSQVDKFKAFGFTAQPADIVNAPLIRECLASIECKVIGYVESYNLIILHAEKLWIQTNAKDKRMFHARGDGTFMIDGEEKNYRSLMENKLPPGI
jgi:flavin reductase (DIM6/NTAB) family NADH-FMN oxidoreductase RutF